MLSHKEAGHLASRSISDYLTAIGAMSAADAQLALNKLVAIATRSVEEVSGLTAALEMLDGVRACTQTRCLTHPKALAASANSFVMSSPTTLQ